MAKLSDRLKSLEAVKSVKYSMPLMIIVVDELTESQKLEIAEAEKHGRNVVLIMRDDN